MPDPLDAIVALLRAWRRDKKSGSLEVVFSDGTPKHVHCRDTLHLARPEPKVTKDAILTRPP